jgi:hypothetical protein
MSIFDPPNEKRLSDEYPEGTPFTLYSADYEGVKGTSFGDSHTASVTVGPADRTSEPEVYRVFGRLAEQTKQLEPGDLPGLVCIKKEGRAHIWSKVEAGGQSEDIPF